MGAPKKHSHTRPSERPGARDYAALRSLDGRHPYKGAVPAGYVDYQARVRRGGRIAYFNFDLAIEMGLVDAAHPRELTPALCRALLDTFAIQIINEYDMIHGAPIPKQDIKPHRYMATRYLQLQHPDRRGTTSGDGRSVWNGSITHRGVTWDVSSCGTGATSLSPATATLKRFIMTGDPEVCYGSGGADLDQGLSAAILSEVLHQRGVPTERTLCVVDYGKGQAINVRAGRNLLRPSHFFLYLRQGNYAALKAAVDFFIDRQVANREGGFASSPRNRYQNLAERMAINFARSAAIFESQYIFVWMDWDGDNILASGGIIDYGSVRQFGLCHHEYRYDDDDRMSTDLTEQRAKARHMVQTFAQLRDYLLTGERRPRSAFASDSVLTLFDRTFEETLSTELLSRIGFDRGQSDYLMRYHRRQVERLRGLHAHFERAKARRGPYKVPDGITWDAIYSMRDLLRELPRMLHEGLHPAPADLLAVMASRYAKGADRRLTPNKARRLLTYLKLYGDLVAAVAQRNARSKKQVLLRLVMKSAVINRADRITGNAVLLMAERLARSAPRLRSQDIQTLVEALINQQLIEPERGAEVAKEIRDKKLLRLARTCLKLLEMHRDGI